MEWLELKDACKYVRFTASSLRGLCNKGDPRIPGDLKRQVPWGAKTKWQIHRNALRLLNGEVPDTKYGLLLERWKEEQAKVYKLKPPTIERNFYGMRSFWRYLAGNPNTWEPSDEQDLNQFTVPNVRTAIANVPASKHGAAENIYKSTMSFYKFLVREGLRSEAELLRFKEFKPPKNKNPKRTFLRDAQVLERLLEVNAAWTDGRTPHDRLLAATLLQMGFHTGMRNRELCHLLLEEVDLEHDVIHIFKSKADKSRKVGIKPELKEVLRHYLKKRPKKVSPYFFIQQDGKPMNRRTVWKRIKNLGERAGVPIKPHGLRTSFITHLLMSGVPSVLVQKIAGHDELMTTELYNMTTDEDALDVLRAPRKVVKPPQQKPKFEY